MDEQSSPSPLQRPIEALIGALGADMYPVRRLPAPGWRALRWLAVAALIAVLLLWYFGSAGMLGRWAAAPTLAWAALGSLLTAIGASVAALELAVPGRSRGWFWLPLPAVLLWLGASGLGCLRVLLLPQHHVIGLADSLTCLGFIVGLSLPLSALLVWLLRRACPLWPLRSAILVGLASAAAAATLLGIFHPFDVAATDLATHALAVGVVIGVNALCGGRLLRRC